MRRPIDPRSPTARFNKPLPEALRTTSALTIHLRSHLYPPNRCLKIRTVGQTQGVLRRLTGTHRIESQQPETGNSMRRVVLVLCFFFFRRTADESVLGTKYIRCSLPCWIQTEVVYLECVFGFAKSEGVFGKVINIVQSRISHSFCFELSHQCTEMLPIIVFSLTAGGDLFL